MKRVETTKFDFKKLKNEPNMNEKAIKREIIRRLPRRAFEPNPAAAWALLPILAVLISGQAVLLFATPVWWLAIPLALICGSTQVTLWSFAHEAAHGTMLRHKGFRRFSTNLAGFFFLYPGELLERWHLAHHRHTHQQGQDPDVMTLEEFQGARYWLIRQLAKIGMLNQFLYSLVSNSMHGNVVLWIRTRELKVFAGGAWNRLRIKGLTIFIAWLCIGWLAGPIGAFFGFLLPWLVGNAIWSSYALAHHQSSALIENPDRLNSTVSIRTSRMFEFLHLHGCHHIEHHLFPRMNWRFLPLVRTALRDIVGSRYRTISHWEAIRIAVGLPLIYVNANTKMNVNQTRVYHLNNMDAVPTAALEAANS